MLLLQETFGLIILSLPNTVSKLIYQYTYTRIGKCYKHVFLYRQAELYKIFHKRHFCLFNKFKNRTSTFSSVEHHIISSAILSDNLNTFLPFGPQCLTFLVMAYIYFKSTSDASLFLILTSWNFFSLFWQGDVSNLK